MSASSLEGGGTPRVLLVLDSLVGGGAETSTVAQLPFLLERGFEINMVTLLDRPGLQDRVRAAGVPLHELAPAGRVGRIHQMRQLIGELRPDLVHTCLYEADITGRVAAALARVPVVSTLATDTYSLDHVHAPQLSPLRVRAAQAVDIGTARLTRRLHAVSGHVADVMSRRLLYPRRRIDVVFRGRSADLARDRPEARRAVRAELGWADAPVVLAVARQDESKGLDRLVTAWPAVQARVPGARLAIAGREGDQTAILAGLAVQAGLDPTSLFLGHRSDMGDLLASADLFVMPSRREGLPGALLEAMAARVPAVVNDLPQVTEVAPGGEVVVVDASDRSALASAIADSLLDRPTALARAERGRARFLANFTLDRAADGIAEFYRRALTPSRGH